jgi:hypothetical protein
MCLFKKFIVIVALVIGAISSSVSVATGNDGRSVAKRNKRQDSSAVSPEAYMTTVCLSQNKST